MTVPTPGSYPGATGQSSGEPFTFAGSPLSSPLQSFFAQGPMIYTGGYMTTPAGTGTALFPSGPTVGSGIVPGGSRWTWEHVGGSPIPVPVRDNYDERTIKTQGGGGRAILDTPTVPTRTAMKESAESVWQAWFHKTPAEIETLQKQLVALNYLSPGGFTAGRFDPKTQDAFGYVLMNVAQYNDPNVTVDKYLSAADTGPGGKAPTSQTTHSTATSYTSSADAEGQYQQIAQQLLGHRATQTAAEAAYAALHGAEAANPSTTNTTTTYDALTGRQTGQSSVSSGGLGAAGSADLLQRQAYAAPDFGVYQAAGPLYNAMIAALAAPSQVGA